MRIYIGHQEAVTAGEFVELASGFEEPVGGLDAEAPVGIEDLFFNEDPADDFRDLFLGSPGETEAQRGSREAVAKEVLGELLAAGHGDEIERVNAAYAAQLFCAADMRKRSRGPWPRRLRKAA